MTGCRSGGDTENIVHPLHDAQQAFFGRLSEASHARDHVYGFNQEQMDLVEDTVAGNETDHEIVEKKHVAYAGGINQYKRRLKTPVWSLYKWYPDRLPEACTGK